MLIRNIWAVGRNYADHAKELGNEVPTKPMIFLKAGSTASVNGNELILPEWATDVHHEVEIALKFSQFYHVVEGALALDLTERTLQNELKAKGHPWTLAKSFTGSCAVSSFFSMKNFDQFRDRRLRLWVNDELKQDGNTSQMIHSFENLIEYVKEHFPVCPGDLLLTGTPAGVGPIKSGDTLRAELDGEMTHIWRVR